MVTNPTTNARHEALDLPDANVSYYPDFFSESDASLLFAQIRDTTAWRQEYISLYGRAIDLPRLTAWYGDEGTGYTYSGIENAPLPWTPPLLRVKAAVEGAAGVSFNSVLLNRYRTGSDSVAWHSDDEEEFGDDPVIASVSLGATRTFQLRHKTKPELRSALELTHGSLLLMRGPTQRCWKHQVPKTKKDVGERLNLTFRVVVRG